MVFVDMVREKKKRMSTEEAVRSSVAECIAEGILAEFFVEFKKEVINVGVFEYNEQYHHEAIWEDGWDVGLEKGMEKGREEGANRINRLNQWLCDSGRTEDLIRSTRDGDFQKKLLKEYGL